MRSKEKERRSLALTPEVHLDLREPSSTVVDLKGWFVLPSRSLPAPLNPLRAVLVKQTR